MEQFMDTLDWPAKAEPFSPYIDDNYWSLEDDLVSNGLLLSVPLSLIEESRKHDECSDEFITPDPLALSQPSSPYLVVPSLECEDSFSSPAYSPISGCASGESSPAYKPELPTSSICFPDDKVARAERASLLLEQLELKHETLSEWGEEKVELPIFEEFNVAKEAPLQDTQSLLQEFETFYGQYQNTSQFTHLTPPQSPPENGYYAPLQNVVQIQNPISPESPYEWQMSATPDIAKELATVDALVLSAVQNIDSESTNLIEFSQAYVDINNTQENDAPAPAPYSEQNYAASEESSPSPGSPSSSSCSTYGSSENDDEWSFQPSPQKRSKSSRSKPYSRYPEDKKSRKKEQNKNAATRYRQKKKAEIEILMEEERELQVKNGELQTRYTDLKREVSYIKGLLRELFKANGLIK